MFAEVQGGDFLSINPLSLEAAIVIFDRNFENDIDFSGHAGKENILVINHDGEVVEAYNCPDILSLQHGVLYPDGGFWIGPVCEGEELSIAYLILTVEALDLLKDCDGYSFKDKDSNKRPTVLAKMKDKVEPLCGRHRCGKFCHRASKFITNGLSTST